MKKIEFVEYNLDNGLKCILHKDNIFPVINLTIGYKVGSKDEPAGKKGIAHLFEHLMFQGSANVKKNEHFGIIQFAGGECNAFTNQDITVYYDKLPANFLETALWLESDRMIGLDLTEENLENQKNVVIEEKLSRYDNTPYGTSFPNILKNSFEKSNYEIATIGIENDIESFTVDEAVDFHSKFYSPSNAVLILSGDFEYKDAENFIYKYFGGIKKPGVTDRIQNIVPPLGESRKLKINDNVNLPALYICYRIPKIGNNIDYTLEYFTNIVSNNKSSILYNKLVYEKKLLNLVQIINHQIEDAGLLIFAAILNEGTDIDFIENEIESIIKQLYNNGIKDSEYEKIRNAVEYHITANFSNLMSVNFDFLNSWFYYKDLNRVNEKINKYLSVQKEDILEMIKDFILDKPKVVLQYLPFSENKK